ncbi:MAG: hypothetical protein IPJ65_36830 [Archangiaceae bacterium]|nr:hypothetical protein [Archangiaceae bacterium]
MKRCALAVVWAAAACSSGSGLVTDAGVHDAGSGPQAFCVRSSCSAGGNYGVGFAGSAPNPVCQPVDDQLTLTSDGGAVCMVKATDGGSDGGCGLQFVIEWSQVSGGESLHGVDTWDFDLPDAGHLYGTWTTHVTGISNCDATFGVHGTRR